MSDNKVEPQRDVEIEVEISPPQSVEDFVDGALEKGDLDEVHRILRDRFGRNELKASLGRLHHRDPVSPETHIYRHAVEIYARMHDLTPANLMVAIRGGGGRKDPAGSEREKLKNARVYVEQDLQLLAAAVALAKHWESQRPEKRDPVRHLKHIAPKI